MGKYKSKQCKPKHICSRDCIYYPFNPTEILKEYIDEFGLKHRECIYLCGLDEHRITKFKVCKNYKKISRS